MVSRLSFPRLALAALLAAPPLAALAEVPRVVADTPIAHSFAAMVLGDLGTPELLLDRGGDPHHAQLRPSQARAVASADLVVWSGASLAPWMDRVIDSLNTGVALDLSAVEGLHRQPFQPSVLFGNADGHDAHDDHADHDDHDHDHGDLEDAIDPHLWLDPENAAPWLSAIATQLGTLDPANAATYGANAAAATASIAALDARLREILAPVGDAGLVMHHAAYGYFARAYDLNILGTVTLGDAADPGAARLAALRDALAGATCIFPESNHAPAHVALVADGAGLRIGAPLDPAGVMLEPGADLYARTLLSLAEAIAACVAQP
ncbi:MAG: zinc ABC transporter substrate-binding protein [Pararhodobacter sp.]